MDTELVALEEIESYLTQGQPDVALQKVMEFMNEYPNSDNVHFCCTGLLIDCGSALELLDPVNQGIILLEHFLQNNPKILEVPEGWNLRYNLANGYATIAKLSYQSGNRESAESAWHKEKFYLQEILINKDKIDPIILPNAITHYASCLDYLGRTVEAVDQYYDCLKIDSSHAVAIANCSYAIKRLFNISKKRNEKLLYESWCLMNKAVELKSEAIKLAGFHVYNHFLEHLNQLENDILNLGSNGINALKEHFVYLESIHTDWTPPLWLCKIQEDRLLLSVNPIFFNCPSEYKDEIIFESMITPLTEEGNKQFKKLCHTFNNIKEDFATSRYLYYQSQSQSAELSKVSSITSYVDTLDYSDFGLRSGFLKTSLRLSADLLDKCAVFLTVYFQLPHPEDQVTFANFWYKKRSHKQGMLEEINSRLSDNHFLFALNDIKRDLFENRYPFPFKTLRNNVTHKRMVLSWYDSLDKEIEDFGLETFREATFQLLRVAKAAIIYVVGVVMLEEERKKLCFSQDELENKMCELEFQTGMGISDQEWLEEFDS